MNETQFISFLTIVYVTFNLTLTAITSEIGVRTRGLMRKTDVALFNELRSHRSGGSSREKQQALLREMFGKDPRIEPLYTTWSRWTKGTVIVWIVSFLLFMMLAIVYSAVTARSGIN